jgi:N4-gp56 family major capsid protein
MTSMGVGYGYAFIPEVWSKDILMAAEKNLVMAKLVERYDADVSKSGDVVHIPNIANITATYKVSGTDIAYAAVTEGTNTITIDKHGVAPLEIEDILSIQSAYDLRSKYTKKLGYGLAKLLDTDLTGLYSGFSQTCGATTSNVGLTKTYVLRAQRFLNLADAPQDERSWVIDGYGVEQLLKIDDFVNYEKIGYAGNENALVKGAIGRLAGFQIYPSNNIYSSGSIIYSLVFHREAMALAMQKNPAIETARDIDNLSDKLVYSCLYGVAELRDTFGVVLTYGING